MIYAPDMKGRQATGEQASSNKPRRLIAPIPKTEPPLEESFVFPAETGGWRRRGVKRDKETKGSISKNKRTTIAIF